MKNNQGQRGGCLSASMDAMALQEESCSQIQLSFISIKAFLSFEAEPSVGHSVNPFMQTIATSPVSDLISC